MLGTTTFTGSKKPIKGVIKNSPRLEKRLQNLRISAQHDMKLADDVDELEQLNALDQAFMSELKHYPQVKRATKSYTRLLLEDIVKYIRRLFKILFSRRKSDDINKTITTSGSAYTYSEYLTTRPDKEFLFSNYNHTAHLDEEKEHHSKSGKFGKKAAKHGFQHEAENFHLGATHQAGVEHTANAVHVKMGAANLANGAVEGIKNTSIEAITARAEAASKAQMAQFQGLAAHNASSNAVDMLVAAAIANAMKGSIVMGTDGKPAVVGPDGKPVSIANGAELTAQLKTMNIAVDAKGVPVPNESINKLIAGEKFVIGADGKPVIGLDGKPVILSTVDSKAPNIVVDSKNPTIAAGTDGKTVVGADGKPIIAAVADNKPTLGADGKPVIPNTGVNPVVGADGKPVVTAPIVADANKPITPALGADGKPLTPSTGVVATAPIAPTTGTAVLAPNANTTTAAGTSTTVANAATVTPATNATTTPAGSGATTPTAQQAPAIAAAPAPDPKLTPAAAAPALQPANLGEPSTQKSGTTTPTPTASDLKDATISKGEEGSKGSEIVKKGMEIVKAEPQMPSAPLQDLTKPTPPPSVSLSDPTVPKTQVVAAAPTPAPPPPAALNEHSEQKVPAPAQQAASGFSASTPPANQSRESDPIHQNEGIQKSIEAKGGLAAITPKASPVRDDKRDIGDGSIPIEGSTLQRSPGLAIT